MHIMTMVFGWSFVAMVIGILSISLMLIKKIGESDRISLVLMFTSLFTFLFCSVFSIVYAGFVFFDAVVPALCK